MLSGLGLLAALSGLVGCSAAAGSTPAPTYYVSIGDSYAAGFQPAHDGVSAGTSRSGFAYLVAQDLPGVSLVNLGCSGFTTTEIRSSTGCRDSALAPGGRPYPHTTQLAAATAFLAAHRGHIAAVTIVAGGDDVESCGDPQSVGWQTCIRGALTTLQTNLTTIVTEVRAAAGTAPIIGLTYPDIYLGRYLSSSPATRLVARESLGFFRDTVNPGLAQVYRSAGAGFVDITAATGAYAAATPLVADGRYGRVPPPVADICRLTFICAQDDVHPTDAGYALIAHSVLTALTAAGAG